MRFFFYIRILENFLTDKYKWQQNQHQQEYIYENLRLNVKAFIVKIPRALAKDLKIIANHMLVRGDKKKLIKDLKLNIEEICLNEDLDLTKELKKQFKAFIKGKK